MPVGPQTGGDLVHRLNSFELCDELHQPLGPLFTDDGAREVLALTPKLGPFASLVRLRVIFAGAGAVLATVTQLDRDA